MLGSEFTLALAVYNEKRKASLSPIDFEEF